MKQLLTAILLIFSIGVFAQTPTNPYTSKSSRGNVNTLDSAAGPITTGVGLINKAYYDTTAANAATKFKTYPGSQIYTYSDKKFWLSDGFKWLEISGGSSNTCTYGLDNGTGIVSWDSGFHFSVSSASYHIPCKDYVSLSGTITLDASDPSLPRIDVIVVDTNSNVVILKGTPATNPSPPTIDVSSQVYLTFILVPAGATQPAGVTNTVLWDENLGSPSEYTASATGLTVNFNGTTTPYHLTKAADVGAFTNNDVISFNGLGHSSITYNTLVCYIKLKSALANTANISVRFNGSTQTALPINKSIVGVYQNISIPIPTSILSTDSITGIDFVMNGANANGYYLDYISLKGGIPNSGGSSGNFVTQNSARNDTLFYRLNGIDYPFYHVAGGITLPQLNDSLARYVTNAFQVDDSLLYIVYGGTAHLFATIHSGGGGSSGDFVTQNSSRNDTLFYRLNGIDYPFYHVVSGGKDTTVVKFPLSVISTIGSKDTIQILHGDSLMYDVTRVGDSVFLYRENGTAKGVYVGGGNTDSTLQQAFDKSVLAGDNPTINGHGENGLSADSLNSLLLSTGSNDDDNTTIRFSKGVEGGVSINHNVGVYNSRVGITAGAVTMQASDQINATSPQFFFYGLDTSYVNIVNAPILGTPPPYIAAFDGDTLKKVAYPSGGGTVTSVTASAPLASSGGATPNIIADTTSGNPTSLVTQAQRVKTRDSLQVNINTKQDLLVSGTNIKTINGSSVLGSGDLVVSGGGSAYPVRGNIFSEAWANTTNWTAVGSPTASVSGGYLSITDAAGGNALSKYLYYSTYGAIDLRPIKIKTQIVVGTRSSTSYAPSIGLRGIRSMVAMVDLTTGSNAGKINWYYNDVITPYRTSTANITISNGDTLDFTFELRKDQYVVTVRNRNTNAGQSITDNIYISSLWSKPVHVPIKYYAVIQAMGSVAHKIAPFTFSSDAPTYAKMVEVGNSIVYGSSVNNIENNPMNILNRTVKGVYFSYGSPGGVVEDINAADVIALHDSIIVIRDGVNNLIAGNSATVYMGKLRTLVNSFTTAGYILGKTLFIGTLTPYGSASVKPYNDSILVQYPTAVIDFNKTIGGSTATTMNPDYYAYDGLHFNNQGDLAIANTYINSLDLVKLPYSNSSMPLYFNDKGYLATGRISRYATVPLDYTDPTGSFHFGSDTTATGGYLISTGSNNARLVTNAWWNGASYIATSTASTILTSSESSGLTWYSKTGNTVGNTFGYAASDQKFQIDNSGNMGLGTNGATIRYKLDLVSQKSQIHTSTTGNDDGGFFGTTINSTHNAVMSAGANNINGVWTAKDTKAVILRGSSADNGFNISIDSSLTIGSGYTPTQKFRVNFDGAAFGSATNLLPNSNLSVYGSFSAAYISKSANYTATISDYTIDCTANTFTVTLPTAVGITGRMYNITNSGAGVITIATTSSQTFTNVTSTPTTLTLTTLGSYKVQSTGSNWIVL